jgi:hypothetical protein
MLAKQLGRDEHNIAPNRVFASGFPLSGQAARQRSVEIRAQRGGQRAEVMRAVAVRVRTRHLARRRRRPSASVQALALPFQQVMSL